MASTSRPVARYSGSVSGTPTPSWRSKVRGCRAPSLHKVRKRFRVTWVWLRQPSRKVPKVSSAMPWGQSGRATKLGLLARVSRPQQWSPRLCASALASMPPNDQPPSQTSLGSLRSRWSTQACTSLWASSGKGISSTCRRASWARRLAASGSREAVPRPQPGNRTSRLRIGALQLWITLGQCIQQ
ncbi:hypothetical protein D3C79_882600 [compost metagenome]